MDIGKYCSNVRMGNWNEELFLEEEKLRLFLKRRERGELLVQKARKLFCNLLKEVSLALPGEYVKFGSVVQMVAPDVPASRGGESGKLGMVLAGLVGEKEVDCIQHFVHGCVLSASPLLTPCVRNAFIVHR
uniref:Uncharacterized protein n=1 Tax=Timema cristinae TaxID=61476 RepID=A0A7R9GTX6_TIMCR|nr:unnamed protein product [Timema cristinae]